MPRRKLILTSEFPYHITARANNKEWFYIPMDICWDIFIEKIACSSVKYNVEIISFILMSNHFHMLIHTPNSNVDTFMNHLMRELSKKIGYESNRINHIFGGSYFRSIITNSNYLGIVYKYIYRNPVVAGVCNSVSEYKYSTLQNLIYNQPLGFILHDKYAIEHSELISNDPIEKIKWLNRSFIDEQNTIIEKGLKKTTFSLTKRKNEQKWIKLFENEYQNVLSTF